ncbi:glycoside hydrolase family 47 protein [Lentinula detonsa]|uniref:alpha-1,2-Mannosidase n=1 Tax=Lentinula detonsa TaxID=2804962 RepID=A0AA38PXA1_9AGAR|nr:glycoside hydrolase family 47 protein [Lentinula detonsa]
MGAESEKMEAIVAAFKHAWNAYVRDAMGCDEYRPISRTGENFTTEGGIGYTIVDAIDTMYLMGLRTEYETARYWIETELSFNHSSSAVSTFETTIRVLGGLLSAHYLTSDSLYLKHAEDLGHRLVVAFNTLSGIPHPTVNLGKSHEPQYSYITSLAEAGSLQLEFKYLAELTNNDTFWYKAERAMSVIHNGLLSNGLAPTRIRLQQGTFQSSIVRLGSLADSYYEYLLKQYLLTKSTETVYQTMYNNAVDGIAENLMQQTPEEHLTYMAELNPQGYFLNSTPSAWNLGHRQEHLVCFLAGSLMLGAVTSGSRDGHRMVSVPPKPHELTSRGLRDWKMGIDFLEGCMSTHNTKTGLAPEVAEFRAADDANYPYDKDWFIPRRDASPNRSPYEARYMLRPEIVESVFIAWRLTGDSRYRDWAWNIFSSIQKHARIPTGGYGIVADVDQVPVKLLDKQETFFMSETLKYLYLTFCDTDVLPLQDSVFNTEAHPIPIFSPTVIPLANHPPTT